ncbi:MAG: hypothetical protein GC157_09090 [Frankiales bacterium]|nr:hypothetical protein [Frankiales bacterium]
MPIQSRCPTCGAAVPVAAAWCSLCNSDLRPRLANPNASSVLPGAPTASPLTAPVPPAAEPGPAVASAPAAVTVADARGAHAAHAPAADPDEDEDDDVPLGRHSRERVPAPSRASAAPRARTGRHAAGSRSHHDVATLEHVELPTADEATREEVHAIAEEMLGRLAVTEPRSRLVSPEDLPGGKWGVMLGGAAAVTVVLLVLGSLLVLLTNH